MARRKDADMNSLNVELYVKESDVILSIALQIENKTIC